MSPRLLALLLLLPWALAVAADPPPPPAIDVEANVRRALELNRRPAPLPEQLPPSLPPAEIEAQTATPAAPDPSTSPSPSSPLPTAHVRPPPQGARVLPNQTLIIQDKEGLERLRQEMEGARQPAQ